MKSTLRVPPGKRALPWLAGAAAGGAVWVALLLLLDAAGILSFYVGAIAGLNAYAFVAAGIARPEQEDDDSFFLNPHDLRRGEGA